MTGPNSGMCRCQVTFDDGKTRIDDEDHEHSDFEPFACTDCDCEGFRPVGDETGTGRNQAQINPDSPEAPAVGDQPHLTIPADLDFVTDRVQDTAEHLDRILAGVRGTFTDPDDPLAVCALADMLEESWPADADSWAALALAARRLLDATNHGQPAHRRTLAAIRRKVQR